MHPVLMINRSWEFIGFNFSLATFQRFFCDDHVDDGKNINLAFRLILLTRSYFGYVMYISQFDSARVRSLLWLTGDNQLDLVRMHLSTDIHSFTEMNKVYFI